MFLFMNKSLPNKFQICVQIRGFGQIIGIVYYHNLILINIVIFIVIDKCYISIANLILNSVYPIFGILFKKFIYYVTLCVYGFG